MRRVDNRQPFIRLFARVVRSNAVLSKETMDAESSEVLGMREGEFGEAEFGEGRRDSECSESGESNAVTYSEPESSLYIPTHDCPTTVVRPIDLPARLCFIELSHCKHGKSNTDVHHVGMQGKFSSRCNKVSWPWGCRHS